MKTTKDFLRFLTIVPAFALVLTLVGCGTEENEVIIQPVDATQEMEDYGAMLEQEAADPYGK
ncbi:hypothetical protein Poly51_15040 [Rubripirellula tenax]|uniref:Uncharacterized protein n=1 Tax=Rubripirellula tenax TaxID=2528015 RepID=A0A5C6FEV2_9BACT|nr:hypothetical protein [Rubripirellula tenax]TWU58724.1 hypothetical protein Poly51_15040 [Rubripirellula tenax]